MNQLLFSKKISKYLQQKRKKSKMIHHLIFSVKFYLMTWLKDIKTESVTAECTISGCPVSATIQKFDSSEFMNINFRGDIIGEINRMKNCFLLIFVLLGLMRKWCKFKLTSICFCSWNFAFQSHMVLRLFKSVLKLNG